MKDLAVGGRDKIGKLDYVGYRTFGTIKRLRRMGGWRVAVVVVMFKLIPGSRSVLRFPRSRFETRTILPLRPDTFLPLREPEVKDRLDRWIERAIRAGKSLEFVPRVEGTEVLLVRGERRDMLELFEPWEAPLAIAILRNEANLPEDSSALQEGAFSFLCDGLKYSLRITFQRLPEGTFARIEVPRLPETPTAILRAA